VLTNHTHLAVGHAKLFLEVFSKVVRRYIYSMLCYECLLKERNLQRSLALSDYFLYNLASSLIDL